MIGLLDLIEFLSELLGCYLEHTHDRFDARHGWVLTQGHLARVGKLHP